MSFWATFDARPIDVHPGYKHLAPAQMTVDGCIAVVEVEHGPPSAQNDTTGVCAYCGIAGSNVLLGVCADCVED